MKKVLFIFAMLLMVVSTYSQNATVIVDGDTVTQTACSQAEKVTMSKVYSDVKSGLTGLAQGLKTTAEHVYVVLVKQQIVYSISYLLFDLVVLTLSILCLTQFFKNEKRLSNDKDKWYRDSIEDHFGLIGFLIFGIVFGAVFIVGLGFNIDNIITGFVNPEYGAIKTIMYFVK